MKKIEKDLIILGSIGTSLSNLSDVVPDYNGEKMFQLGQDILPQTDEELMRLVGELANECYNRVKKKFPKDG